MALTQAFLDWEQKTEQRGIEQGLQQGLQQGQSELVLKLLQRKFGEIKPQVQTQIQGLTAPQLDSLGENLLDLVSMSALIFWLEQNS